MQTTLCSDRPLPTVCNNAGTLFPSILFAPLLEPFGAQCPLLTLLTSSHVFRIPLSLLRVSAYLPLRHLCVAVPTSCIGCVSVLP